MFSLPDSQTSAHILTTVSRQSIVQSNYMQQLLTFMYATFLLYQTPPPSVFTKHRNLATIRDLRMRVGICLYT